MLTILTAVGLFRLLPISEPAAAKKKCKHGKKRCQGRCIPKANCCTDADCTWRCAEGQCQGQPCATNAACGENQLCWAFQCLDAGGPCPSDGHCAYGQLCRDGICWGGGLCFLDVNCESPQICPTGTVCVGGNPCGDDAECDYNQSCQDGVCQGGAMSPIIDTS